MARKVVFLMALLILSPTLLHGEEKVFKVEGMIIPDGAPKPRGECAGETLPQRDLIWVLCDNETIELVLDITHSQHAPPQTFVVALIHYLPDGRIRGWLDVTFPVSGLPSGLYRRIDAWEGMQDALLQGFLKRDPTMAAKKFRR